MITGRGQQVWSRPVFCEVTYPLHHKPYVGKEKEYIIQAIDNKKICGDGEFTKKCHKWHFCDVKLASSSKKHANWHTHVSAVRYYLRLTRVSQEATFR